MKNLKSLLLAGTACLGAVSLSQCGITYEGPNVSVCQWPGDRNAAISYTFDDNLPNQFSTIVPMMNEFDMKCTLFPVINWLNGDFSKVKEASDQGHEIGSHTVSHPNLGELSDEEAEKELHESRLAIEEITGKKCITIAYPYCSAPKNIQLVANDYINARVCDGKIDSVDVNFMRVSAHPLGTVFNATSFDNLKFIFEKTRAKGGWSTLLFHEIDLGNGYSPFPSEEVRKSLEYLNENESIYWVAPMGDVARYMKERLSHKLEVKKENGDYIIKVSLEDLDEEIYNQPLTFRYTKKDGSLGYVDVIPDGNPVKLDI